MHSHAREKGVGVTARYHHRAEIVAVEQQLMRFAVAQPLPLAALPQIVRILVALVGLGWVFDQDVAKGEMVFSGDALDRVMLSQKNRRRYAFVRDHARGANDLRLFAFRKYDALRVAHCAIDYSAHYSARPSQSCLQLLAIILEVDHVLGDAAGDRGPGD